MIDIIEDLAGTLEVVTPGKGRGSDLFELFPDEKGDDPKYEDYWSCDESIIPPRLSGDEFLRIREIVREAGKLWFFFRHGVRKIQAN